MLRKNIFLLQGLRQNTCEEVLRFFDRMGYLMNTGPAAKNVLFSWIYEVIFILYRGWNLRHLLQGPERLPTGDIEAIFSLRDSDFTFSMVGPLY